MELLTESMRRLRVGGSYWAAQPILPRGHVIVRSAAAVAAAREAFACSPLVLWNASGDPKDGGELIVITGERDPWHVLESASALISDDSEDELFVIARLIGLPSYLYRAGKIVEVTRSSGFPDRLIAAAYENPFTGEPMSALEAVELCGFWRKLIDSNRELTGGIGFAFWKQAHVAPLLWDGSKPFHFLRTVEPVRPGEAIAVWRAKASAESLAALDHDRVPLVEVEDGFLRSHGLGADCIPPLSITVDRLGAYFDPARPSELENLLEDGDFDDLLLARAAELRRLIVESGLGKYERGGESMARPAGDRRHILVPGQVEDDRAVQCGGCGLTSNLELLQRVRDDAPDAYILYKPHPDVVAGHRRGAILDRDCLRYADQLVGDLPIASLIDMVDEVQVNTSLAGFEALLRGKRVTTHGVPFYAGWGLTRDLGPVPPRRTAKRSVDELVTATLLLYPRYLDPRTGLPCPAEIVVARLSGPAERNQGMLVGIRRLQGKVMRRLRSLVQ